MALRLLVCTTLSKVETGLESRRMGLAVNIQSRKGLWVSQWGRPVVLMGYKNDGNRSKTLELEKENRKCTLYKRRLDVLFL